MTDYDAVVVGGGPAGLAAAVWLGRYRRRTLVIDSGDYRNRWVEQTHGYLGHDPIDPAVLREAGHKQLASYSSVKLVTAQVLRASGQIDDFLVESEEGQVRARRLVIATGVRDVFPDVKGFFEHYGASAFHCPSCDGFEARDRPIVVLGWSKQVTGFALSLLEWAASVTVVTDGRHFEGDDHDIRHLASHGIEVVEDGAVELVGRRGQLEGLRLRNGRWLTAQMAFFSIDHHPVSDLAQELGCQLTDEGCVRIDANGATTVPGVYAAGDLTPGLQLVQVAASKGTAAGVSCAQSLLTHD